MEEIKPFYSLRREDFKPFFIGLANYEDRCTRALSADSLRNTLTEGHTEFYDNLRNAMLRRGLLLAYNFTLVAGAAGVGFALYKGLELLTK